MDIGTLVTCNCQKNTIRSKHASFLNQFDSSKSSLFIKIKEYSTGECSYGTSLQNVTYKNATTMILQFFTHKKPKNPDDEIFCTDNKLMCKLCMLIINI
jgi:hypothetical protein